MHSFVQGLFAYFLFAIIPTAFIFGIVFQVMDDIWDGDIMYKKDEPYDDIDIKK